MKILQIINSLGTGGAEKLLLDTIPLYRKSGIEMDILILWNNQHQFTKKLKELNCCKVYILSDSHNIKDIYNPFNIHKIRKILKDYDLAHVHLFPAQYFVPIANIGLNRKLIFTEHSTSNRRINNFILAIVDQYIYKSYRKIVSISDDVNKVLKKHIVNNEIIQINNGVAIGMINNASSMIRNKISVNLKEIDKIIIQISAFREGKDQDTVVKSLEFLPDYFKVIFVGDGVRREIVESLVDELNLQDRVIFLGQRMDVPELLKSSDYVVLSTKYEGLSLASVEGLASGKPFLGAEVPGLKEIIDGAGVLFNYENAKQLADEILKLENDEFYKNSVIQNCLQRAEQYDIHLMVDKHIDLYRKAYEN